MKKIFSILVFVVILAGGGYFAYNEFMKTKTPDVIAVDTGSIAVEEINSEEFEKLDKETKDLIKKYEYVQEYSSFEELNKNQEEDGSYLVSDYGEKKLFLVNATKQKDGQVVAVFSDKE